MRKKKYRGDFTPIRGNRSLIKNSINIFKIRVNKIDLDKTGLKFGFIKESTNILDPNLYKKDWLFSCSRTQINPNFKSFGENQIDNGDIVTFIVDLINGTLSIKKNDFVLGKLSNIPKNEDLLPCALIYYVENEIEIID